MIGLFGRALGEGLHYLDLDARHDLGAPRAAWGAQPRAERLLK